MLPIRAFFAIHLLPEVQKKLADWHRLFEHESIRLVPINKLHVTLHFLKAVQQQDIEKIVANTRQILTVEPFDLLLDSLELFPTRYHPRFISVHIAPDVNLTALVKQIGNGIVSADYPLESRPFRAHLTFARANRAHDISKMILPSIEPIKFNVDHVTLFQSVRSSEGSVYAPLAEIRLRRNR